MRGACSAAIQHDRIVQHAARCVLELLQPLEEVGNLLTQKQVVLRKGELTDLVFGMRQIVMRPSQPQLDGECVTDPHAIFAIQHECDRTRNVGVKGECNQIEHIAIVGTRFPFRCDLQIEVRIILLLQRDIDPLFGGHQPRFNLVQRGQVLVHLFTIRLAQLLTQRA